MLRKCLLLATTFVVVFSLSACGFSPEKAAPTTTSEETELKYDHGISEGSCSSGQQGFLVWFSPSGTSLKISQVKLFANLRGVADQERKPKLEIWDKDYNVIYATDEPYTSFSSEPGWVTIEIPEIIVNDDFYVVFYTNSQRDNGIYMHYDLSVTNRHSETVKDRSIIDWVWGDNPPKAKTNWMIRVVGTFGE